MAAALKNNPVESCIRNVPANVPFNFSNTLDLSLPATAQGRTGRCWLFSGLTTLRYLTKSEEEYSYVHLFYHDKVERYRQTLFTLGDCDGQLRPSHRSIIFKESMSDGGQWDLFVALVKKFGLMPRSAMPETFHANSSKGMCRVADEMLRVHSEQVMNVPPEQRTALIHAIVDGEVSRVFADLLGAPPESFISTRDDADKEPRVYFKEMNVDLDEYVSIVHDPRLDGYPMWHELQYVYDCAAKRVGWIAVSVERMEKLAVLAIEGGTPVWFGANTECIDRESGIHDPAICSYGEVWPEMGAGVSKKTALETFLRVPTHAMVLTGVHKHKTLDVPVRWQVDNSWGQTGPHKGKHVMTTLGFRESVFQVVIPKKLLNSTEVSAIRDPDRTVLVPPDDPLATLARLL